MEQFRKLKANEIEVRIAQVNKGGVNLLLYKDARVDQNILDETFGIFGWKRSHQLIGDRLYCTVEVRNNDTGEWISKQDVGTESYTEKEKGQASDSFKRACFNLGIGRELYSAPEIFYPKSKLAAYEDDAKPKCYDKFRVKSISYADDGTIAKVTIDCMNYGKVHSSVEFSNATKIVDISSKSQDTMKKSEDKKPVQKTNEKPASAEVSNTTLSDDEVLRVGNCRGKKYGEVKTSDIFLSFLNWARTSSTSYTDPVAQRQFMICKQMGQKIYEKKNEEKGA